MARVEASDTHTGPHAAGLSWHDLTGKSESFGFEGRIVDLVAGSDLGGVTILRLLAEGGMGRVYEGRQQSPTRLVAVKVLRFGLAGRGVMRRFEQEAQLLARLRHPHIAQIYTFGTCHHDSVSVPFFVMELVEDALPIDRFVRDRGLTVRERVAMLRRVAAAVAHGHRMGIVHRDLKPGNILVGGDGEPKVIDFGVARSTDADLALTTMQTDAGQIVGTLRYMSPEQFDTDSVRIGPPTDVYALGLVLHEVLTGELPYDIRGKPIVVAARIIREQEPQPMVTLCRALRSVSGVDASEARQLAAVTAQCLQKRPGDRYATAEALEAELANWLAGRPVRARPSTFAERASRFVRRHPGPAAAAVLVCMAGLVTAAFSSHARQQERLAQRHQRAEQQEAYYSAVQRAAAAADRRNTPLAASLLERGRSMRAVSGRPIELDCLEAKLDDSVATMRGHEAIVRAVAASPTGDRVVTGDDAGVVRIWEADDAGGYRELHVLRGHKAAVWSAALSCDGSHAVTTAEDGVAISWDVVRGSVHGRLRGHTAAIYGCAYSPDGHIVATASADGTVGVWDAGTCERRAVVSPEWRDDARDRNIYGVEFIGGGDRMAAACGDGVIRIWNVVSATLDAELRGHGRRVFAVRCDPDSRRLASASEDGTARIWNLATARCMSVVRHTLRVNAVAWTADGAGLATVSADAIVRLWNPEQGLVVRECVGHRDAVWSVTRTGDDRFVTVSADATARVWNVGDHAEAVMRSDSEDGAGVRGVACSSDGRLAATATSRGQVRLWDMVTCTANLDLPRMRGRVNAVAFSPAANLLAAACGDGAVRLFDAAGGTEVAAVVTHAGPVFAAAFSPDGRRLATAGAESRPEGPELGSVRIQSLPLDPAMAITLPHPARAYAAAWSPDARRVVTACADGLLREWDANTAAMVGVHRGHGDDVNWVAWSSDGSRIASASSDGTVRLWKPGDGWSSVELNGPVGQVWKTAFSPDGTRVAGVGADGSLHLWHAGSGRHLLALDGHEGPLWGVVFSPDGRTILTGSDDGIARVWGMSPAELNGRRQKRRQPTMHPSIQRTAMP